MQVCGLEHFATGNGFETRRLVSDHLDALRDTPCFARARIILVPEANLGNEAQEVAEHCIGMAGLTVLAEKGNYYGVWTQGPNIKSAYVFRVSDLLAHRGLRYHDPLVVANPFLTGATPDERRNEARREFERQLRSFRRIAMLPRSLGGRPRIHYTGKSDQDNTQTSRLKDDMCMALLFGVYWSGQHKNGMCPERGYNRQLVRPDGVTIAPVVEGTEAQGPLPHITNVSTLGPGRGRVARLRDQDGSAVVSELAAYERPVKRVAK